jgi:hypothetical protein
MAGGEFGRHGASRNLIGIDNQLFALLAFISGYVFLGDLLGDSKSAAAMSGSFHSSVLFSGF